MRLSQVFDGDMHGPFRPGSIRIVEFETMPFPGDRHLEIEFGAGVRCPEIGIAGSKGVEAYSLKYEKHIGQILSMHSGINTGLVVTGNVDFYKGTHGIAGAPLNIASR